MGFENKDSFYKELKEEQRSNGSPKEQTEAKRKDARPCKGGTIVLQGQKGGMACSMAVPPIVRWRKATRTPYV